MKKEKFGIGLCLLIISLALDVSLAYAFIRHPAREISRRSKVVFDELQCRMKLAQQKVKDFNDQSINKPKPATRPNPTKPLKQNPPPPSNALDELDKLPSVNQMNNIDNKMKAIEDSIQRTQDKADRTQRTIDDAKRKAQDMQRRQKQLLDDQRRKTR